VTYLIKDPEKANAVFGFNTLRHLLETGFGPLETQPLASQLYGLYTGFVYLSPFFGGILADKVWGQKKTVYIGGFLMAIGHFLMAIESMFLLALFFLILGNGAFKPNISTQFGNLYEPGDSRRDGAFTIFYMGINVGAFFAPFVAKAVKVYWLKLNGYIEDSNLPSLCHQFINGTLKDTTQLKTFADASIIQGGGKSASDLSVFAHDYINVFSTGYNYAFGVAAGAMILSLIIYIIFNKLIPASERIAVKEVKTKEKSAVGLASNLKATIISLTLMVGIALLFHLADQYTDIADINYKMGLAIGLFVGFVSLIFQISTKEERPRVMALFMVFFVVIFFWMSFHQNGLTLTMFARDYTAKTVGPVTNLFFNLESMLCVIGSIAGCVLLFFNKKNMTRMLGGAMFVGFGFGCYYFASHSTSANIISPEVFQSFNPLFIVALTPLVMGVFAWLNKKGMEPSSPRKIGIGMIIASIGFVIVLIASLNLTSPKDLAGAAVVDSMRVSPYWLMSSYLIMTIAELFLSPIGLSFVSKVAPARFQGLMQGGWLLATAIGNKFLFVGSLLWGKIDLYILWGVFIMVCILAALFIFSIMKRLENATK
ncbi:MAG: peptide MFS transporter, partial [Bacteroidota bacterium]